MIRSWLKLTLVTIVLAGICMAAGEKDATVELRSVVESRSAKLKEAGVTSSMDTGISLELHLDGPALKDAKKYRWEVTQALDDVGTNLLTVPKGAYAPITEYYSEIRTGKSYFDKPGEPPKTGFEINLKLPSPTARSATTIKTVTGSVTVLAGGEAKTVVVPLLKSKLGTTLDNPVLKAAGLTITLDQQQKMTREEEVAHLKNTGGWGGLTLNGLYGTVLGDKDLISDMVIESASGEKLGSSATYKLVEGKERINLFPGKDVTDDMSLKVTVMAGQRKVTVPVQLNDIKLP